MVLQFLPSLPTCFLIMSKLQTPENVPAIEHEREAVLVSSPDGKVLSSALIQAIASVPAVDLRGLEPIVTRKELWSYYCMFPRDSPLSV